MPIWMAIPLAALATAILMAVIFKSGGKLERDSDRDTE